MSIYLKNMFYGDEERKMINFPLINKRKAWIWISYLSKKHEQEITLNFIIFKDGTLNLFIFKKGNHPTLDIR